MSRNYVPGDTDVKGGLIEELERERVQVEAMSVGIETEIDAATTDVTALDGRVTVNEGDIATNVGDVATNTAGVATNVGDIATNTGNVATNAGDIATSQGDIATLQTEEKVLDVGGAGVASVEFAANTNADDLLTINGRTYCFGPTGPPPAYDVAVVIGGNANLTIDNLVVAVNGDAATGVDALKAVAGDVCMLVARTGGVATNFALAESTGGARLVLSAAAAVGGKDAARRSIVSFLYTVTAQDVLVLAGPSEVPVMGTPSVTTPEVMSVLILRAGAIIVLPATILYTLRQFNVNYWGLCLQDTAATLLAADIIHIVALV